jgi:hypothetical protein
MLGQKREGFGPPFLFFLLETFIRAESADCI